MNFTKYIINYTLSPSMFGAALSSSSYKFSYNVNKPVPTGYFDKKSQNIKLQSVQLNNFDLQELFIFTN